MKIEKLENNWRDLAPQNDKINTLYYDNLHYITINKINEIIDEVNQMNNEQSLLIDQIGVTEKNRSEQLGRYLDMIERLELRVRSLEVDGVPNDLKAEKEPEILVCPFCNTKPQITEFPDSCAHIKCGNSKCIIWNGDYISKHEAISAWNTRA